MKSMYSAGLLLAALVVCILLVNCTKTANSSDSALPENAIEEIAALNFTTDVSVTK